jgi:phage terminase large subunit
LLAENVDGINCWNTIKFNQKERTPNDINYCNSGCNLGFAEKYVSIFCIAQIHEGTEKNGGGGKTRW